MAQRAMAKPMILLLSIVLFPTVVDADLNAVQAQKFQLLFIFLLELIWSALRSFNITTLSSWEM